MSHKYFTRESNILNTDSIIMLIKQQIIFLYRLFFNLFKFLNVLNNMRVRSH